MKKKGKIISLATFAFLCVIFVMHSNFKLEKNTSTGDKIEEKKPNEKNPEDNSKEGDSGENTYEENNPKGDKSGEIDPEISGSTDEFTDIPDIEIPNGTVTYHVETIIELSKRDLKVGDIISTDGYYVKNDGGASTYIIIHDSIDEDGFRYIKLDNGLLAKLVVNKTDYINVMQAGIKTNENNIARQLNLLISYAKDNSKGIKFNTGRYIIDSQINICAMEYIGTNTEIWVSDKFTSGGNSILTNDKEFSEKNAGGQFRFENISFTIETTNEQSIKGMESLLVCIKGVEKCTIENCNFVAKQSQNNGQFTPIDLLWFQNGDTKNVYISNSYFCNEVGKNVQEKKVVGGCIWFSCLSKGDEINDITIQNCTFISYCKDEIIAFWGAKNSKEILIDRCKFEICGNSSDNVMAFNGSSFSDLKIIKSEFNIKTTCVYIVKFTGKRETDTYQVELNECNFNISNDIEDITKNVSILYIAGMSSDINSFKVEKLEVSGTEKTKYRNCFTLMNVKQMQLNIVNNAFDICTGNGLLWAENSAGDICINQNDIKLHLTSTFMVVRNTVNRLQLTVENNTINNRLNGLMQRNVDLIYNFIGNKVLYDNGTTIFQNDGLIANDNISTLNIRNNYYINANKVSLYYSPNKDSKDKYLIINSEDSLK